jgi:hypothetical protein
MLNPETNPYPIHPRPDQLSRTRAGLVSIKTGIMAKQFLRVTGRTHGTRATRLLLGDADVYDHGGGDDDERPDSGPGGSPTALHPSRPSFTCTTAAPCCRCRREGCPAPACRHRRRD